MPQKPLQVPLTCLGRLLAVPQHSWIYLMLYLKRQVLFPPDALAAHPLSQAFTETIK